MLPPLMILLTAATGIVDAVAYLQLGYVFVANVTGNVVFLVSPPPEPRLAGVAVKRIKPNILSERFDESRAFYTT